MISEMNQLGTVVSFEALKLGRRGKVRGTMAWTVIILTTAIVPIFLGYINTASPEAFFTWVLQPSLFGLYLYFAVCILAGDSVTSEFARARDVAVTLTASVFLLYRKELS